jgi:uroporphyrinogen-III synthase
MSEPLQGTRIVVTRSEEQAEALTELLCGLGAIPIVFPTIQFVALAAPALGAAFQSMDSYDWLLLTSANAVRFFWQALQERGYDGALPAIAVSGSKTATTLDEVAGLQPDLIPDKFVASSLVAGLGSLEGKRVLLPRSRIGGKELVLLLEAGGAEVEDIALYDTVMADPDPNAVGALRDGFDVVTFASPSGVRNFVQLIQRAGFALPLPADCTVACVGPVTAEAAREQGMTVNVVAEPHTMEGLVQELVAYYAERQAR